MKNKALIIWCIQSVLWDQNFKNLILMRLVESFHEMWVGHKVKPLFGIVTRNTDQIRVLRILLYLIVLFMYLRLHLLLVIRTVLISLRRTLLFPGLTCDCVLSSCLCTSHRNMPRNVTLVLTTTQQEVEYRYLLLYNHLPSETKNITNYNIFKKRIFSMLVDMEPYCLQNYWEDNWKTYFSDFFLLSTQSMEE